MTSNPLSPSSNPSPINHHPLPSITVELFGVPRLLVEARSVAAAGTTLADLAADLVRRSPALAGRVLDARTGWPLDGYSFVVDEQFTRDRDLALYSGTSVLLVASAAGG
jgi:molybdopterin converting factor small subunit